MCMGNSPDAPAPPPVAPEAAQMPVASSAVSTNSADRRRRLNAMGGGTIITGSRGVTDGGNTAVKTLLGQ